mmetsp:Transcript_3724/g.4619  ORF Transcript_3724/g.4619 Transcript_3724/m.4619 type:complete len:235 (-) Transcript_3724:118-822(-)
MLRTRSLSWLRSNFLTNNISQKMHDMKECGDVSGLESLLLVSSHQVDWCNFDLSSFLAPHDIVTKCQMAKILTKAGADPNTCLWNCSEQNPQFVRCLLECGADPNFVLYDTPVIFTISRSFMNLKLLLDFGADLSSRKGYFTLLHYHISMENLEMINHLIALGYDTSQEDSSCLLVACNNETLDIIKACTEIDIPQTIRNEFIGDYMSNKWAGQMTPIRTQIVKTLQDNRRYGK